MNENRLQEIIQSEMQFVEELSGLLQRQQHAIIHFQDGSLMGFVEEEQRLLRSIESLEKERVKVMGNGSDQSVEPLKQKMKILAQQVLDTNKQNRVLIDNALLFVRQLICALTENFTRQLVDTKV
ncbi:MAG TPA: flagellar export chaperone FlgN [Bacteroidota bacterium]|nr:flagellar export chaperone FlgN [Bacteroidota bacterium]